jgi:hypothetical protein
MRCSGIVSLAGCNDVIVHLDRDMDRLYALHQIVVHPAKHVAYAAFWIRKIKPVSFAWPMDAIADAKKRNAIVDEGLEVADINERICLHYMCHQICEYVKNAQIATPASFSIDKYVDNIRHTFSEFIIDRAPGPALNNRFEAMIYDMRYRTFGPHHLVHTVNYLLKEAAAWKSSRSSTQPPKKRA